MNSSIIVYLVHVKFIPSTRNEDVKPIQVLFKKLKFDYIVIFHLLQIITILIKWLLSYRLSVSLSLLYDLKKCEATKLSTVREGSNLPTRSPRVLWSP